MGVSVVILVVIVVLVAAVVMRLLRHERRPAGDGHGVRRFFQYALLLGLLWVAGSGVAGLLTRLLDVGRTVVSDPSDLAVSTAFTVVGVPLYVVLAVWTRRRFAEDPSESRSRGWHFYLTTAALGALAMTMAGAYQVLASVTGLETYEGRGPATFVVWGLLWLGHWVVERRLVGPDDFTLHRLVGSGIGLIVTAIGAGSLLADVAAVLFGLAPQDVFVGSGHLYVSGVVTLAVGLPVWLAYWVVPAARYRREPVWLGYVLLAGVAGGLVTAVAATSLALYDALVWLVGSPSATLASEHFQRVPQLLAAALVGGLVWWYHRLVLREGGAVERTEAQRVYEYVVAGVGLLAAATGLMLVVAALLEVLAGSADVLSGGTSALNTVIGAGTLLVVGVPVWFVFWRRIQAVARAHPPEEHASPSRRVYVLALFGVAGVAAVGALLVGVVMVLQDVFAGTVSADTVRAVRYPLGIIVATGTLSAYHWTVYRDDQGYVRAGHRGPRFVLLVGPADADVGRALARRIGGRVEVWTRADGLGPPWSVDDLADTLADRPEQEVMVLAGADGSTVVPIERS